MNPRSPCITSILWWLSRLFCENKNARSWIPKPQSIMFLVKFSSGMTLFNTSTYEWPHFLSYDTTNLFTISGIPIPMIWCSRGSHFPFSKLGINWFHFFRDNLSFVFFTAFLDDKVLFPLKSSELRALRGPQFAHEISPPAFSHCTQQLRFCSVLTTADSFM